MLTTATGATQRVQRVAFITATEPEPRRYGKHVVMGGILDHLCERLGPDNVHLILIGPTALERPAVAYRRHVIAKPSSAGQVLAVMRNVVLKGSAGRRQPLQEAVLHSPRIASELRALLDDLDPDLEIWDTVRTGQYAPSVRRRRRVLYADDLFSERYAALLRDYGGGRRPTNPGGQFQKLLPLPARMLLAQPAVQRPLLRVEQALVAVSEQQQSGWFDATYLVNAQEAERLRARTGRTRIESLPPLLREPQKLERRLGVPATFSFVGGFDYAPNRDGIDWFLRECRTLLAEHLPHARIQVIGMGSERGLTSAAAWGGRVSFLGFVSNLDAVLIDSVALLSPLRSGSGIKLKVLEALARGLPVVATPAGVQGVDAGAHSGCLIGSSPQLLVDAMVAVCDPALNAQLSRAARHAWDTHYAAAVVRKRYDEAFGLIDERPELLEPRELRELHELHEITEASSKLHGASEIASHGAE